MMDDESRLPDKQQRQELTLDHVYESRHELVTKLAYELWEQRGRPVGSPNVDWFAAEQAVYASLPVSYTHLDVYKRQTFTLLKLLVSRSRRS